MLIPFRKRERFFSYAKRASDPARHRARTCRHKRRYCRRWQAEEQARVSSAQSGGQIIAYSCRYCKGWHLGHIWRNREEIAHAHDPEGCPPDGGEE